MEVIAQEGYQTYQRAPSISDAIKFFSDAFPVVSVDTETNGEDVRDGRGMLYGISASIRFPGIGIFAYSFNINHPNNGGYSTPTLDRNTFFELKNAIENYKGVLVFHNAKFDLESLRTVGINYTGKFVDTMLLAHLLNENMPFNKSLDACGKYYLKDSGKKKSDQHNMYMSLYGWAGMPYEVMVPYAEYDAVLTLCLYEHLWAMAEKEEITDYWFNHKAKFLNVIRKMESRGVRIDVPMCLRMTVHGTMIMEDIVEILDGKNPGSSKDLKKMLIDDLGLPLVKPTKATAKLPEEEWKPSFDKDAMAIYDRILERQDNDLAVNILTYRGWQKAVSSNYKPYVELLSPDGRLRPNYKLHGTKTGRSSCEKPNLQQIPREGDKPWNGDMKTAFLPENDDWELWEFDYGQLEFRLATGYSGEPSLMQAFLQGRDVFSEMSTELGFPRQDCKTLTYTIQYGGGLKRLSDVFGVTKERAAQIRATFFTRYSRLKVKSDAAAIRAKVNGKVRLWSGRYRHFMYPKDEAHKAFNSVIQGGAADIVEKQMIRLFNEVDNDDECRMLLTVHDSVIFEIRKDKLEYYKPKIISIMEDVGEDFLVKFAVDAHKFGDK